MRSLEKSSEYKRGLKRELNGRYRYILLEELPSILSMLANDIPLPEKYRDHALTGNWKDHRECHIRPDLLLVYQKISENILRLVGLGSHAELF